MSHSGLFCPVEDLFVPKWVFCVHYLLNLFSYALCFYFNIYFIISRNCLYSNLQSSIMSHSGLLCPVVDLFVCSFLQGSIVSHRGLLCPLVDFFVPSRIFLSLSGFLCPLGDFLSHSGFLCPIVDSFPIVDFYVP